MDRQKGCKGDFSGMRRVERREGGESVGWGGSQVDKEKEKGRLPSLRS